MNVKLILSLSLITVLLLGVISFDDAYAKDDKKEKQTKLQKECAKDPKSDDKIKAHCELLGLINDADAGTSDPRTDSFFDVFFDVFTVDSFFDIFTELQTQSHDKYTDQEAIDAVGLHTVDADTTYSGADFAVSDQNCAPGSVVSGINADGNLDCNPSDSGMSCENQRALVTHIPEFNVDVSCFEPLSLSINIDVGDNFGSTYLGQLSCENFNVNPEFTGGVPLVKAHWEFVSNDGLGTVILAGDQFEYEFESTIYWEPGWNQDHLFTLKYVVIDNVGSTVSENVDFGCTISD
jgi:hypothetical protein